MGQVCVRSSEHALGERTDANDERANEGGIVVWEALMFCYEGRLLVVLTKSLV